MLSSYGVTKYERRSLRQSAWVGMGAGAFMLLCSAVLMGFVPWVGDGPGTPDLRRPFSGRPSTPEHQEALGVLCGGMALLTLGGAGWTLHHTRAGAKPSDGSGG